MKLLLVLPILLQGALGWGEVGHRTVAYLAYKYLRPETKKYVDSILASENMDISDGAIWPDQIRHQRPKTGPWHYIDALDSPPALCGIHYPSDCGKNHESCIVSAINQQTAAFMDPNTDTTLRREALKFILHFIGDIHQPLHVENLSRGGNGITVCWHRACHHNLHSVWDTSIPHQICGLNGSPSHQQEKKAAQRWADQLAGGANWKSAAHLLKAECSTVKSPDSCSLDWAREANHFVCTYVLKNGVDWFKDRDLSTDYYYGAKPVVEYLIGKAGVRLAAWLEAMVATSKGSKVLLVDAQQQVLQNQDI